MTRVARPPRHSADERPSYQGTTVSPRHMLELVRETVPPVHPAGLPFISAGLALAVLGRNHAWAGSNFRVAVAEARLFKARGDQELWADALRRARQTAGERTVPAELLTFPSRDKS